MRDELELPSISPSGDLFGRLPECFRGPSHGRTRAPSTQGRARCVSEGQLRRVAETVASNGSTAPPSAGTRIGGRART